MRQQTECSTTVRREKFGLRTELTKERGGRVKTLVDAFTNKLDSTGSVKGKEG